MPVACAHLTSILKASFPSMIAALAKLTALRSQSCIFYSAAVTFSFPGVWVPTHSNFLALSTITAAVSSIRHLSCKQLGKSLMRLCKVHPAWDSRQQGKEHALAMRYRSTQGGGISLFDEMSQVGKRPQPQPAWLNVSPCIHPSTSPA